MNIKKDDAMAGELNKREFRQHISEARLTSSDTKITQTDPNVNTQSPKKQFSARDELVADAFGDVLSKVDFAETVHKADKRLFDKIAEWLDKLLERFKKALRTATEGVTAQSDAAATLREAGDKAMHLFNSWSDAFASALENSTARTEAQSVDGEVQFSLRGVRSDGIEVYETSEEIKKLSYKERKNLFLKLMSETYRGRTAKFYKNGHYYYARFDDGDVRKIIYGNKKSDNAGRDAIINQGADGSIFELVENSKFDSDSREQGKQTKSHRNVIEWDYFVKTVQIDETVFDLLANVRKKSDDSFVYSLQLNENKKIKAEPSHIPSERDGFGNSSMNDEFTDRTHSAFANSISPTSENVNRENKGKQFSARDYTYESLIKKPDMKVTTVSSVVPDTRADVIAEAKKNAAAIGKTNKDGSVSVYVKDVETDVILSRNGLEHGLDRRFKEIAPVTICAGEIIQNSIRINELIPSKEEADASYVLIGAAQNSNGDMYIIRSVVNKFSNELDTMDVLYAINAKKESTAVLNAPLVSTPDYRTVVSISRLLDFVNDHFPDILPESVLKHYGHKSRPEGKLGESALFSARDVYDVLDIETRADLAEHILTYIEDEGGYRAQLKRSIEKKVLANKKENRNKSDSHFY